MWDIFQIFTTLCGLKLFRRSNNAWRRKFCVEDVSAWEDYIFHVPESLDFSWHWHHSWLFLQSSENVGNAFSMIYCINTSFSIFINNKLFWSRLDTYLMVGREFIHRRFDLSKTKVIADAFRVEIRMQNLFTIFAAETFLLTDHDDIEWSFNGETIAGAIKVF